MNHYLLQNPYHFYLNQNLEVEIVNKTQIQYHIQNKKIYLENLSAFLVNLKAPNKQFFRVQLSLKSFDLGSNS